MKALKPDISRGGSLKLVTARTRDLICPVEGCTGRFAEQKEVNRHVRNSHHAHVPVQAARLAARTRDMATRCVHTDMRPPITDKVLVGDNSEVSRTLSCPIPTCSKVF